MNLSVTQWIQQPLSLEQREVLDFLLWIALLVLCIVGIIVYLIISILLFIIFILLIIDIRLIIINNRLGLEMMKKKEDKKENY